MNACTQTSLMPLQGVPARVGRRLPLPSFEAAAWVCQSAQWHYPCILAAGRRVQSASH